LLKKIITPQKVGVRPYAEGMRLPAIYIPHGGGPWPWVSVGIVPDQAWDELKRYLLMLVSGLPERPKAIVVISAHWEERVLTLMSGARPPMLYDYGFPDPKAYEIQWPAPGDPLLAANVAQLLKAAGFPVAFDEQRGFDHGTFVPLKVAVPEADIPIVQLSLLAGLDPKAHIAIGKALAPLRDQGVLIVGSGSSYHNLRDFGRPTSREPSRLFDDWLADTVTKPPSERDALLVNWATAPAARHCHPREEHLIPLHVVAGAGGNDTVSLPLRTDIGDARMSAVQFG
jgi:aromatic ring-opening dioxygenase catalytic subunit (LigB family)